MLRQVSGPGQLKRNFREAQMLPKTKMKSTVLAKPNLKGFLLGAILIAVVQNFIANGHSPATVLHARSLPRLDSTSEADLQKLLALAETDPNSELYGLISRCYEKRGEMKKALLYLRKAQFLAQTEEAND